MATTLTIQNHQQTEITSRLKTKKHVTLPTVLCGRETWSFVLNKGKRLRMFQNRALRWDFVKYCQGDKIKVDETWQTMQRRKCVQNVAQETRKTLSQSSDWHYYTHPGDPGLNAGTRTRYPDALLKFTVVSPSKFTNKTLNWDKIAVFPIPSNSLFTDLPTIRCYIILTNLKVVRPRIYTNKWMNKWVSE